MALLETIRARNSGYFVDHFINFLCVATHANNIEVLSVDECQKLLEREFGFNIPQASIALILNRATKKEIFQKIDQKYSPKMEKISQIATKFNNQKESLITQQKKLIKTFIEFAKNNHSLELNSEDAEKLLLSFFKKYQYELTIRDSSAIRIADTVEVKNPEYLVSLFVTENYREKTEVSSIIETITKGYFVANFINIRGTETDTNNLRGLTVILDTPILMGLTDFNGKLRRDACVEMIKLGNSLGVKFIVFEHIFDEWESIFFAWSNDLRSNNLKAFNASTLALLNARRIDSAAIETMIPRLRSKLDSMGIKIIDRPDINPKFSIDEVGLKDHLLSVGLFDTNGRLERDVKTVGGIAQMRKGRARMALHEEPTVFVTTNYALIREINNFMGVDISDRSIQVVNSDVWLTNLCWMVSPDVFPELPHQYMIANCYGAMNADDRFWESFLVRLRRLKSENKISADDYKLVRYEVDLKVCIKEMSIKVGTEFSDEAALDAVKETKNKILNQKTEEINTLIQKQQKSEERINLISDGIATFATGSIMIMVSGLFLYFSYLCWKNQSDLVWAGASSGFALCCLWFDVSLYNRSAGIKLKLANWIKRKLKEFFSIS
ncbi:hypothetical protein CIK05_11800 [Bdellovibrio sp. qaytius]|nr:hypothetical protein CIK05_11800 [Bdellovibrio sp. qaytius]